MGRTPGLETQDHRGSPKITCGGSALPLTADETNPPPTCIQGNYAEGPLSSLHAHWHLRKVPRLGAKGAGDQTPSGSDLPLLYLASAGCMVGEGQPRLDHPAQCPVLLVRQVPVTSFMLMREAWRLHQRWENLGVLRGQGRANNHAGRVPTGFQDPSSPSCHPPPSILSRHPRAVTAALLPATLASGPAHRPFGPQTAGKPATQ